MASVPCDIASSSACAPISKIVFLAHLSTGTSGLCALSCAGASDGNKRARQIVSVFFTEPPRCLDVVLSLDGCRQVLQILLSHKAVPRADKEACVRTTAEFFIT